MFSTFSVFEFQKQFAEPNACYEYLSALKLEKGFVCNKCGCTSYTRNKALLVAEIRPAGKIGRVYLQEIGDYTSEPRYPVIEDIVANGALVVTNKYPSHARLKKLFSAAQRRKSNAGKGLPAIHRQTSTLKAGFGKSATNAVRSIISTTRMNTALEPTAVTQKSLFSEILCNELCVLKPRLLKN